MSGMGDDVCGDPAECEIHTAGIRAMMAKAAEIRERVRQSATYGRLIAPDALEPMGEPFFGRWCEAGSALGTQSSPLECGAVCADSYCVGQRTQESDSESGTND
jgi:hypothetical protein